MLVTGGTSGIGLALAEAFLRKRAKVTVCARTNAGIEAFEAAHPDTLAIPADIRDLAPQPDRIEATPKFAE